MKDTFASGWPGIPARWTSSAKSGLGTAVSRDSRVWFTLSHGILNEVYYPRVDHACTRDLGFIVTDGQTFFSEEKRDARSERPPGRTLRVETLTPALVRWSVDNWRIVHDTQTRDMTLGVHVADLRTESLRIGDCVNLTFHWSEADRWDGVDFVICVE